MKYAGLIPYYKMDDPKFEFDYCGKSEKKNEIKECTNMFLRKDLLQTQFDRDCKGQTDCELNLVHYIGTGSLFEDIG